MGTQFWTWAEILDQFFESVFKDNPPTHTPSLQEDGTTSKGKISMMSPEKPGDFMVF